MKKVGFERNLHSRRQQFMRRSITFDQFNLMPLIIEYALINDRANHDNVAGFNCSNANSPKQT